MKTYDLTTGSEWKTILSFSLPMIGGSLLQQLYNIVDTYIVGIYLGRIPLAAVGSSFSLMVLLNSVVIGLCLGAGVVFSQYYGEKDKEGFYTAVWNAAFFIMSVSIILTVISYILLDDMIVWLRTPQEAIPDTRDYLWIVIAGIVFTGMYNILAVLLRSVGESLAPLWFLAISAVVHIVLAVVFICIWDMGVEGPAAATVAAQAISVIGLAFYVWKDWRDLIPPKGNRRRDGKIILRVVSSASLTSIQQSAMNFGILMIQGLVNSFGVVVMAAFSVVVKIDTLGYLATQEFGNALGIFVAQNHGARLHRRIARGVRQAALTAVLYCGLISLLVNLFAGPLMVLFVGSNDPAVVAVGVQYLRIEGSCYIGIGLLFLLYGYFRGLEKSWISIVLTVISLGLRVCISYICAPESGLGLGPPVIWLSIPIGWAAADIAGLILVKRFEKRLDSAR